MISRRVLRAAWARLPACVRLGSGLGWKGVKTRGQRAQRSRSSMLLLMKVISSPLLLLRLLIACCRRLQTWEWRLGITWCATSSSPTSFRNLDVFKCTLQYCGSLSNVDFSAVKTMISEQCTRCWQLCLVNKFIRSGYTLCCMHPSSPCIIN